MEQTRKAEELASAPHNRDLDGGDDESLSLRSASSIPIIAREGDPKVHVSPNKKSHSKSSRASPKKVVPIVPGEDDHDDMTVTSQPKGPEPWYKQQGNNAPPRKRKNIAEKGGLDMIIV